MDKGFVSLRKKLISEAKRKVRDSVSADNLIIQAVSSIEESDKAANMLAKRLREWYSFYLPEFSDSIASHEKFAEIIIKKGKKELMKEINLNAEDSMGADIPDFDVNAILKLAELLGSIYSYKQLQSDYIDSAMKKRCPNVTAVAGSLLGAKLISSSGSLHKLSRFPASTIQMLGAEKALFRHLKTGARAPKYGHLHEHQLISSAQKKDHGKIARMLADKIAIAAKVDFFRGKFVGQNLMDDIKRRLKK